MDALGLNPPGERRDPRIMASLRHEIWEESGEDGAVLHTLCLAGSDGDAFRAQLHPDARLTGTFEADSHFEAMTIYCRRVGYGTYATAHEQDHTPYPDEWALRQRTRPE